jgi:hypothetical protein
MLQQQNTAGIVLPRLNASRSMANNRNETVLNITRAIYLNTAQVIG